MLDLADRRSSEPLRALIYCRVSADPHSRRVSVESQETENRAVCEHNGWDLAGVVVDNDRSASRFAPRQREGYALVREALAGNGYGRVDVLVCWESSRAQRDLEAYVALRNLCAEYNVLYSYRGRVYDMSDDADRFNTGLDALVDERNAEEARNRTLRSHRHSATNGLPRGATPYGYQRRYDPVTRRMVAQEADPKTAPIVTEIVGRLLGGDKLYRIAQDLNQRGIPTPRQYRDQARGVGDRAYDGWTPSQIRNLVSKPSLQGLRVHRGQIVGEATWPAIVDPADWEAVQALLRDPHRVNNYRGVRPQYLCSGLAECGVCGARGGVLRPMRNRGRMTYACAGAPGGGSRGHVSRGQELLDAAVTQRMVGILSRPDALQQLTPPEQDDRDNERERLKQLTARLATYQDMAIKGEVSPASFAKFEAALNEQIEKARADLTPQWLPAAVVDLVDPEMAAQRWDDASLDVQRAAVRLLLRIVVHPVPADQRGGPGLFAVDLLRR